MPRISPQREREVRERIVRAATVVLAERGFDRATMQDIVRESGLSVGAIYTRFKGKSELILASCDAAISQESGELRRRLTETTDYRERIAVAVDARKGWVAGHGWQETSQIQATDLVQRMGDAGVRHVIYTDIIRDGTLRGPNIEALAELVALKGPSIIASGGVGSVDDLLHLAEAGACGAIVGQALYAGVIDLPTALQRLEQARNTASRS